MKERGFVWKKSKWNDSHMTVYVSVKRLKYWCGDVPDADIQEVKVTEVRP